MAANGKTIGSTLSLSLSFSREFERPGIILLLGEITRKSSLLEGADWRFSSVLSPTSCLFRIVFLSLSLSENVYVARICLDAPRCVNPRNFDARFRRKRIRGRHCSRGLRRPLGKKSARHLHENIRGHFDPLVKFPGTAEPTSQPTMSVDGK